MVNPPSTGIVGSLQGYLSKTGASENSPFGFLPSI
jgi:hypothetical protein